MADRNSARQRRTTATGSGGGMAAAAAAASAAAAAATAGQGRSSSSAGIPYATSTSPSATTSPAVTSASAGRSSSSRAARHQVSPTQPEMQQPLLDARTDAALADSFTRSTRSLSRLNVLLQLQIAAIESSLPVPSTEEESPIFDEDERGRAGLQEQEQEQAPELSFLGIEKLAGKTNYFQWKYLMKCFLDQLDVWSAIDSPTVTSSEDITAADTGSSPRSERRRSSSSTHAARSTRPLSAFSTDDPGSVDKNSLAFSYIRLSVSDAVLPQLTPFSASPTSARQAWLYLDETFGEVTVFDRISTDRALYRRVREGESLAAGIRRILAAVEYLRWAGDEIDDITLVRTILASLPDSYDGFIKQLETEQLESSQSVIGLVLDEERDRRRRLHTPPILQLTQEPLQQQHERQEQLEEEHIDTEGTEAEDIAAYIRRPLPSPYPFKTP